MISAATYNLKGEKAEATGLPKDVFEVKVKPQLLAQVARVWLANQRKSPAKTKTRGEVAKTTAKMYKQKGTGRARHGSYAAPIFVGGGVAHGPSGEQNYKMSLPVKMRRLDLLGALSAKAEAKQVMVVTGSEKASGKTKQVGWLMGERGLVVAANNQDKFKQAIRNLRAIRLTSVNSLSAYDVLANKRLILTKETLAELKKTYAA